MRAVVVIHGLLISWAVLSTGCTTRVTPNDAWTQYNEQHYDKAERSWRQILKREPLSGEAYYGLALAQLRKGDSGSAEQNLMRAMGELKQGPHFFDCFLQLGNLYLVRYPGQRAYMDAAGRMADSVLKVDGGNFSALLISGEVGMWRARDAFSRNDSKAGQESAARSIDLLRRAAAQKPGDSKVQRNLALSQELAGDLAAAADSWQRTLAVSPNDVEGYRRLLRLQSELKHDAACVRVVDQATQLRPVNVELVLAVAEQALDIRRFDLFDRAAASIRSARDQFAGHYEHIARLLRRRGLPDEAVAYYQLAERRDPSHWAQHRLATVRLLLDSGRIAEARTAMQDLRKSLPDDPKVRVFTASMLRRDGKLNDAMSMLQTVLATSPGELDALLEQARIYRQQGNYPMAIAVLIMCQRTSPDSVPVGVELAETYLASGMKPAAELAASTALTKDPGNADAQRLLAAARQARP